MGRGLSHTWGVFQIQINMKLLLVLLPLATAVPIKIISYSATEEKHNHEMEGVPGEAVMGEFSFKAPDTGDAVYKLTYTADMDGFQAMGDHLPVPVIMDPVPEQELPAMVDYTPAIPFTGSSLRLQPMFLHLLRRVTMNLLPSHYKAPRRSCTRSSQRASRNTQTLFNEI